LFWYWQCRYLWFTLTAWSITGTERKNALCQILHIAAFTLHLHILFHTVTYMSSKADTYNEPSLLLSLPDEILCCGSETSQISSLISFAGTEDVLNSVLTSSLFCVVAVPLWFVETDGFFRVLYVFCTGWTAVLLDVTATAVTAPLSVRTGFDAVTLFGKFLMFWDVILFPSAYKWKSLLITFILHYCVIYMKHLVIDKINEQYITCHTWGYDGSDYNKCVLGCHAMQSGWNFPFQRNQLPPFRWRKGTLKREGSSKMGNF